MILTTSEESRLLDQRAMTEYGLPESVLMENAGASVVQLMKEKISWEDARVVIVCGSGNNGGDGFVTARYALSEGADVAVLVMGDASHMGENSLLYKNIAAKMGIPVISVAGADDAKEYLAGADIIVDALIGTGLKHHVKGSTAELITAMNDSEAVIVSVDVPSGMFSDSGWGGGECRLHGGVRLRKAGACPLSGKWICRNRFVLTHRHPKRRQGTFSCKAGGRKRYL